MGWRTIKDFVLRLLNSWVSTILLALCLVIVGYFLVRARYHPPYISEPGPVTIAPAPAPVERIIEKVRVVKVPGPERVVFLEKAALATALKMPELKDLTDNVLSVGTVAPTKGPTTVIATLSPTGEGKILLRQEPQKWFEMKKEWGIRAGFGTGNLVLGEVYVHPVRLGVIEAEVRGFVKRTDKDGTDFGGAILVDYKF